MSKKKQKKSFVATGMTRFNRVSPVTNFIFSALAVIAAILCVAPVLLVIAISISTEHSLAIHGYQFIPSEISFRAYQEIFSASGTVLRAFLVTIGITVSGTLLSLAFCSTFAYVLSRPKYHLKKFLTIFIVIPMLFSGGMIPFYNVVANTLKLQNNYLSLILPMAVSTWNIIIMRTFFQSTIPDSIIESAQIDGASQLQIFMKIIIPISTPAFATVGLFQCFAYWNDWWNATLFITDEAKIPLQRLLMRIQENILFLQNSKESASMIGQVKLPPESLNMAIVVVSVIPIALAYPYFQKYFIAGLTVGAVKG